MKRSSPIVYFDGECALCTGVVQFILKRDKKKKFRFASLQGAANRNPFLASIQKDSVVLEENNIIYVRSTAALRICKWLGGGWSICYAFIVLPLWIRDGLYNFIARNRYKWFGKKDQCWVPDKKWADQFLD